jgi:plasmid stability protein
MSALQVKNFPDDLHAKLRKRAARKGRSVSSYVLDVLTDDLERPDWDEWFATLDTREPVDSVTREDVLAAIDEGRNEREEQLIGALLDRRR